MTAYKRSLSNQEHTIMSRPLNWILFTWLAMATATFVVAVSG